MHISPYDVLRGVFVLRDEVQDHDDDTIVMLRNEPINRGGYDKASKTNPVNNMGVAL